jgi:hypothetical protein
MEHDLAARERPAPRDGEQLPNVLGRQVGEQRPLHRPSLAPAPSNEKGPRGVGPFRVAASDISS